ncbi:SCO family protein [Pontibacillus sp. HMF3514]|uniref:SCO family protein n=1 Tax=Pontibacillus sp. HMF3514 TaxID=2692425 RepID=UPI00191776D6|nr:SCO family protein [Pontibacillus sp. HMF3514]
MVNNRHQGVALLLVLLFGGILFYLGTDGFRVFTAEEARVNQLMEEKPQLPEITLEDSEGQSYLSSKFKGKYVLMTFFYTACSTVCPQLERNMERVYDRIPKTYLGEDIVFLSVSFDTSRDDPATLHSYQKYFKVDGDTWRMVRVPDSVELESLLDVFGVIVIPDNNGNFAHNSAFYLVNRKGALTEVMDYTKVEEAADTIVALLEQGGGKK